MSSWNSRNKNITSASSSPNQVKIVQINTATKTLSELEKDHSITESSCDISKRYLGLPPSKRFYKRGETDFEGMRRAFDAALHRLGIDVG